MTDAEVLFSDISDFKDFFVTFNFMFSQSSRGRIFSHDAICNFVFSKEVSVGHSGVPFIGKYLFNGLFGVAAEGGTVLKQVGVIDRGGCEGSGQDKAVVDTNGSMFFEAVMRLVIFDNPVRVKALGVFFGFSVFIQFAFRSIHFFFKFFDLRIADRMICRFNKPGIDGDALHLPVKTESVESIVCTGVLEHTANPHKVLSEIYRILKFGGKVFIETPFMQTVHASPHDFYRWTPDGLRRILSAFEVAEIEVVAGPGSALAWQFQATMAMLFSMNKEVLYKIGLRIFVWIAVPISWLDVILEKNLWGWDAASGFALLATKPLKPKE